MGYGSLAATFAFLLVVLSAAAAFLRVPPLAFASRLAVLFVLAFACWVAVHDSYIAAAPNKRPPVVEWLLGLTGEADSLLALIAGLLIGNLLPKAGAWFKEAAPPSCSSSQRPRRARSRRAG